MKGANKTVLLALNVTFRVTAMLNFNKCTEANANTKDKQYFSFFSLNFKFQII